MVSSFSTATSSSLPSTGMLSALRRTASHILSPPSDEEEDCLSWELEATPTLSFNLDAFHGLMHPFSRISWTSVSSACMNTVVPVLRSIQKTYCDDLNGLVQYMAELDPINWDDYELSVSETAAEESIHPHPPRTRPCLRLSDTGASSLRRRRKSVPELCKALVIKNDNPTIPTIIVTPCPTLPRDRSCLVPYQDVSFGNRLAVPMHPVVNDTFPPLLPKPVPYVDRWRFQDGHWWAVLPTPEEQMLRGMFSRPVPRRRRLCADGWNRSQRIRRPSPKPPSPVHQAL
ncbi:hypothetical protein PHLGIDRAFT_17893 [Phlebiopsis gigantea 11061_1 CR5-6]|uniref:Uncharacterized protein n=1 Tax=Phlebiopsis gigantea (strain 11061_1 CR5-6) TaxID=745531 RepID=A0A0C3SFA1_PHLG1|nr:hypothetical protein PHLGIDRAFT_17893 [Phlebiopsis gigantea 11061_1 CR5-6]